MNAHLRFATTDEERAAVYRLRYELYVEGQGLFLDEADHKRRWLTDDYDAVSPIAIAELDGEIVGTIRLTWGGAATFHEVSRDFYDIRRFAGVVDERDIILVNRLMVRPDLRGGPLGCQLFHKAFEFAAEHNAELILGACEIHLVSHYRKLGFRPFSKLYNHPTNGALVPIVAVTGDFEYLEKVQATTLETLRRRSRPAARLEQIRRLVTEGASVISQDQLDSETYAQEVTRGLANEDVKRRGILHDLSRDEMQTLLAKSHVLTYAAEDALFLEGHVSRTLYVLLSGSLEVRQCGGVAFVEEPGAVVGEVATLSSHPRMNDAVAGPEGARVLALSYGTLRRILASNGSLAAKLLRFFTLGLCDQLAEHAHDRVQAPVALLSRATPERTLARAA